MTSKKAITISAIAVASILILSFGLVTAIAQVKNQNLSAGTLLDKLRQREDGYQQLIDQANQRIEDLNNQVQGQSQTDQAQAAISVNQALAIAYQAAGSDQPLADIPQLVNYQGTVAYEIPFVNGLVYIDAGTGTVLSNSVQQVIDENQAVEIAAAYLGVTNTSSAQVSELVLDGTQVYKVTIANYVIFVDKFGTITKLQVLQYSASSSSSQSGGTSVNRSHEDDREHEEDDD